MRNSDSQIGAGRQLYPVIQPYFYQMMEVSDGHTLYVEECGNPDGIPVVVLHGGPGGGCSPGMRRFFHPDKYRIILFDQRGCGRSTPHASVEDNTTWHLVDDIERIRKHLGVENWIVFGGSWGATLSLVYAQKHPMHVRHLVLRGVFLMTFAELNWFYGGGAARFFPEQWQYFEGLLPKSERGDIIAGYGKRLFGEDKTELARFARAWTGWETALAYLESQVFSNGTSPTAYDCSFSLIEKHYFSHKGFLEVDGQIMRDIGVLKDIPGTIFQGRYDMICPPETAIGLHNAWPSSRLIMASKSGHSLSEPQITSTLVEVMDELF